MQCIYLKQVTSDVLFGNIGGNLGLFVGMSLLSFVELIELGLQFILVYVKDKKRESYQNQHHH